ncbi:MAG: hypothetical protein ABIR71_09660 [Chthoniobacterales bacterium]
MNPLIRQSFVVAVALLLCATQPLRAQEDVAIMDEIIVEAPFDLRLELPKGSSVEIMIERMRLRTETERALELKIANRDPISRLLDLTNYSPIPLGASESRIDTFFQENALRADLNPRRDDPLSLRP